MEVWTKKKDLKITNADKGMIAVIMDTESYIKEANRQLSDGTYLTKQARKN